MTQHNSQSTSQSNSQSNSQQTYQTINQLKIHNQLINLVDSQLLAQLGMNQSDYWLGLENILAKFTDENQQLIAKRAEIQNQINDWCEQ